MSKQEPFGDQLDMLGGSPAKFIKNPVHGYAARPGSGPAGEKCKTCACAYDRGSRAGKSFWKCSLVKASNGSGTDIRLKSPACSQWRRKEE